MAPLTRAKRMAFDLVLVAVWFTPLTLLILYLFMVAVAGVPGGDDG